MIRFAEVCDRPGPDPQRDGFRGRRSSLDIVDDQYRLRRVMYIEPSLRAAHLDPDLRPRVRHEIDVCLVPGRRLTPQAGPGPLGTRDPRCERTPPARLSQRGTPADGRARAPRPAAPRACP